MTIDDYQLAINHYQLKTQNSKLKIIHSLHFHWFSRRRYPRCVWIF